MIYYWMRRDLRLEDNPALTEALAYAQVQGLQLKVVFIFDPQILKPLAQDDARVSCIHRQLRTLDQVLRKVGSGIEVHHQKPLEYWKQTNDLTQLYWNRDYEPSCRMRDGEVYELLQQRGVEVRSFQDHLFFEPGQVLKQDGTPYTVYTPFKNKWLSQYQELDATRLKPYPKPSAKRLGSLLVKDIPKIPTLEEIGFVESTQTLAPIQWGHLAQYAHLRDYPAKAVGTMLSPHLRMGTVGTRQVFQKLKTLDIASEDKSVLMSELIWREFFIHILFHFPQSSHQNFKKKYDGILWRDDQVQFKQWCEGKTGYPLVDAGMRELNQTGYMHNRVRMVVASFLIKHLMIDWRWGERYFASKLLDYELASNAGNWQWAAGTGCDAAPYFRIFNPITQLKKFDPQAEYVRKWIPELDTLEYPEPMVDHKYARQRCLESYQLGISD